MTGAGNDFVLIDSALNKGISLTPEKIKLLCDRRFGIGADGLLLITDSDDYSFMLDYFNADGYPGSLCGNGSRCAIHYAATSGRAENGNLSFNCDGLDYSGKVIENEKILFNLNPPSKIKRNFRIKAAEQMVKAFFADTGSPHVVIFISDILADPKNITSAFNDIEKFPADKIGREIRYSKDFAPKGTNVNFILVKEDKIYIRTYERGVEAETLACGTGSVAAAVISALEGVVSTPVEVFTRGGILTIDFSVDGNKVSGPSLTGPAKTVFNGNINL